MVQLNNYISATESPVDNRQLPLLNSLFQGTNNMFSDSGNENSFKSFMKYARRSPQLMGFLNIIATDILSDDINFVPTSRSNGRNNKMKAKEFWDENDGVEIVEESLYDLLITGIGYNWLGSVSEQEAKERISYGLSQTMPNMELKARDEAVSKAVEINKPSLAKKLAHVASSTMTILHDDYGITGFKQKVGGNTKLFTTEEILKFKLMPLDGKIYPFPPMEALLAEIYLLWLISQNYVSYFENGGKPDNVFVLPKEIAGSKNHSYLIETLKKYKKVQNKHGNLVFTGDLSVTKMMEHEDQMEYKDLGLYLVGILAMMYGVPVSRIPFLLGKSASSGESGGLADSGYWRKISVWQAKIESVYNKKLWRPFFNVEMKFRRGYLQDEVREVAADMTKTQVAEQRISLGLWTPSMAGSYLNIDNEDIVVAQAEKKKRDEEVASGMLNQNLISNDNALKNQDMKEAAEKRQKKQNNNQLEKGGKNITI